MRTHHEVNSCLLITESDLLVPTKYLHLQNAGCFAHPAESAVCNQMGKFNVYACRDARQSTDQFVDQMGCFMTTTVNCTGLPVTLAKKSVLTST